MAPINTIECNLLIYTHYTIVLITSTIFISDKCYVSSNIYNSRNNLEIRTNPDKASFGTATVAQWNGRHSYSSNDSREKRISQIERSFISTSPYNMVKSRNVPREDQTRVINIGIVGNDDGDSDKLREALTEITGKLESVNIILKTITIPMKTNPLEMSQDVCYNLIESRVSAVIVENPPSNMSETVTTTSISFTCGLYNIPIIGTDDRDSRLSNKNIHPSFLRLVPPFAHQADVWMELLFNFAFNRVAVVTTSDDQGILSRLGDLIDQRPEADVKIETLIEFESTTSEDMYEAHVEQTRDYLVNRITDILNYSICRVFLIHATNSRDLSLIFDVVHHLNMDADGFVLILSEAALVSAVESTDGLRLKIPNGSISARLKYYHPVDYKIDALKLIANAIHLIASKKKKFITDPPRSCSSIPEVDWATGLALYHSIVKQGVDGLSGYIAFNELGDRAGTSYDILNIINSNKTFQLNVVGSYSNSSNILIHMDKITWPGFPREKPSGTFIKKHLKIVTLQERPFVWIRKGQCHVSTDKQVGSDNMIFYMDTRSDSDGYNLSNYSRTSTNNVAETISITSNTFSAQSHSDTSSEIQHASVPCKKHNKRYDQYEDHCCEGYCMDLLDELSRRVNFTYEVYIVEDNQYGTIQNAEMYPTIVDEDAEVDLHNSFRAEFRHQHRNSDTINKEDYRSSIYNHHDSNSDVPTWNGLIGELVSKRADMSFAPLSVTSGRAQVIDFSKPFKFHGFSILLRRASMHTTLASFLQPFHNQLWALVIGVATHVVALSLYLLDRYSAFGRFGMKKNFISSTLHNKHGEHPLHFTSSIWFSWSILLNSGIGEHTPKSLSGRVLGMFWSGFAMIVVSSYTANLAAFLVLDSREEQISISGINDPRLRSGDSAFSLATVRGSAVDSYLQSRVEYINLYRRMEEFNFANVDDAIEALRNETIDALIWDSTRLEWETSHDEKCSLGIAGELFGRSGYGIGLQKNSYWTKNVTTELLELHESGFMMDLDRKWILAGASSCDRKNDEYPETLGISNIAGVFILFACGILTSFGLIVIERAYVSYRKKIKLKSRARSQQQP